MKINISLPHNLGTKPSFCFNIIKFPVLSEFLWEVFSVYSADKTPAARDQSLVRVL